MAAISSEALGELNSAETRTLFDTADQLSSLGVGRIVDLPQIIVVGDQSSGKSSVLEAISHIRFPVQGGVCTRFATELVLRPSTRNSIAATVHFANGTLPVQTLQTAGFDQQDISGIVQEAKEKMGISGTNGGGFSKHVLRLEIEGPGLYPLTLVDLPGIFHAATAKQTVEGKATVMELVESYMKKPNSIILTIISANNELANQAVMQMATKHDPHRTRTLGVITKPDLLPAKSTNEAEYLQLIRGRDPVYSLALGWHVLRNRADYEVDKGPRETVETKFFESGLWASIAKADRGVASLRKKLSRVLLDHIKKGLPTLLENLQERLSERQLDLRRLGQPRSSLGDMRSYLIDIASNFERLVHDGIHGRYNTPFYRSRDGQDPRLRAQLRNFSKALRFALLTFGCTQDVIGRPGRRTSQPPTAPKYLEEFMNMHQYTSGLDRPKAMTWTDLTSWLERQAAFHQGTELPGYVNMDVVNHFFQATAKPWEAIAERHLQKVLAVTKVFVEAAFEHIVGSFSSNSTTRAILFNLVDEYFDTKEKLLATKLKELLRPYQEGYALPLDADFHEAMANKRRAAKDAAMDDVDSSPSESEEDDPDVSESDSEFGIERIIDTVHTFYDMALRTFTDNVINLAVESCLVQDLPNIFTPRQVSNMDETMLQKLAAESPEVCDHRALLKEDIRLLKEGLERCRPYKPRAKISIPAPSKPVPRASQENVSHPSRPEHAGTNEPLFTAQPYPEAALPGASLSTSATPAPAPGQTLQLPTEKPRSSSDTARLPSRGSGSEKPIGVWANALSPERAVSPATHLIEPFSRPAFTGVPSGGHSNSAAQLDKPSNKSPPPFQYFGGSATKTLKVGS
ncbi:hypothetical protein CC79DRAFT_727864 [Sarocladium strictum]